MATFTFAGFYPTQYDTPEGSAIVAPGRVVEWPDGPPNEGHGWVETPDVEPTLFEELGVPVESEEDSTEKPTTPDSAPSPDQPTTEPAADETAAEPVSTQVTDTDAGDTTDQPDSTPATSKRTTRAQR